MKRIVFILTAMLITTLVVEAQSQNETSIAKGLGLYVFPSKDQTKDQQELDEYKCYKWAKEQTGFDPVNPTKVQAKQVDRSVDGTAVRGAARGAAAGAAWRYCGRCRRRCRYRCSGWWIAWPKG